MLVASGITKELLCPCNGSTKFAQQKWQPWFKTREDLKRKDNHKDLSLMNDRHRHSGVWFKSNLIVWDLSQRIYNRVLDHHNLTGPQVLSIGSSSIGSPTSSKIRLPCCSFNHCTLLFSSMKYEYARRRSSVSTCSAFRFLATTRPHAIRFKAYRRVVCIAIDVNTFVASAVSWTSSS